MRWRIAAPVVAAAGHVDGVPAKHRGGVARLEDPLWIGEVAAVEAPQLGGGPGDLLPLARLRQAAAGDEDDAHRVAVIVESAHPARFAPLLMSIYGLTGREQDVTRRPGCAAAAIWSARSSSPTTKPRQRDTEARAAHDQPLRGGPFARGEIS